jgi:uncharacterized membrane protein YvbJ
LALVLPYIPARWIYSCLQWTFAEYDGTSCPKCDYDLTGNISGICPECGSPVPHFESAYRMGCGEMTNTGKLERQTAERGSAKQHVKWTVVAWHMIVGIVFLFVVSCIVSTIAVMLSIRIWGWD